MKLEAIREDRTRGGRSTYQCSYTVSPQQLAESRLPDMVSAISTQSEMQPNFSYAESQYHLSPFKPKREPDVESMDTSESGSSAEPIPRLLQDILSVEHLWHNADKESNSQSMSDRNGQEKETSISQESTEIVLCNIADHRLYKIVKWCKSLPLFREIGVCNKCLYVLSLYLYFLVRWTTRSHYLSTRGANFCC